jgi:hypothetical protein
LRIISNAITAAAVFAAMVGAPAAALALAPTALADPGDNGYYTPPPVLPPPPAPPGQSAYGPFPQYNTGYPGDHGPYGSGVAMNPDGPCTMWPGGPPCG